MASLYTPPSNTTPGSQLFNLQKVLSSITSMPSGTMSTPDVQNAYSSAQSGALNMGANSQDYVQNAQNTLTQQSGIPQLQGNYGDLSKLFDLYLHDSNMASKYTSGQTGNISAYADPTLLASALTGGQQLSSGNQANMQSVDPNAPQTPQVSGNPYLASTDAIVNSVANAPQAPSLTTAEMSQPLNATSSLMNLLGSLIGSEQSLVSDKTKLTAENYKSKMDTLQKIADIMGGELSTRRTEAKDASTTPGTKQNSGSIYNQIITELQKQKGDNVSETDVWNYINERDAALRAQGVNVDELWKLQKDQADKVNKAQGVSWGGLLTGGKSSAQREKDKKDEAMKVSKIKAFGDLVKAYDRNSSSLGGVSFLKDINAIKQYSSQRDLYLGGISKDLGISRSNQRFKDLQSKMPGDTVAFGSEGSFRGHLATLLDLTGLVMYIDPKTGETGVDKQGNVSSGAKIVDPQTDDFNLIKNIIGGL